MSHALLLALVLSNAPAAVAPAPAWKPFRWPTGAFEVQLPGEPKAEPQQDPSQKAYVFQLANGEAFEVFVNEMGSTNLDAEKVSVLLHHFTIEARGQETLVDERELRVPGAGHEELLAREFTSRDPKAPPEHRDDLMKVRAIWLRGALVELFWAGPPARAADYEQFVRSFKVLQEQKVPGK